MPWLYLDANESIHTDERSDSSGESHRWRESGGDWGANGEVEVTLVCYWGAVAIVGDKKNRPVSRKQLVLVKWAARR